LKYGGQTSCVAVSVGDEPPHLMLDAGSGMAGVTPLLDGAPYTGSVLLSHLHWDHTHGMPFFGGGFSDEARVDVLIPDQGSSAEAVLERCFSPPHFPIVPAQLGAGWSFNGLDEGEHHVEGFTVLAREVPHKGGRTFGYRVSDGMSAVAYFPDHSPTAIGPGPDGLGARHDAVLALSAGVDVLIADAQHLASQFPGVDFLGHAAVEYDVELARECGVSTLVLFHHAPTRTDDEIDVIEAMAKQLAGSDLEIVAGYEGLVINLPARPNLEVSTYGPAVR
jgi:phosphoribosyl 1,2-cyclic phosphodiesterase